MSEVEAVQDYFTEAELDFLLGLKPHNLRYLRNLPKSNPKHLTATWCVGDKGKPARFVYRHADLEKWLDQPENSPWRYRLVDACLPPDIATTIAQLRRLPVRRSVTLAQAMHTNTNTNTTGDAP